MKIMDGKQDWLSIRGEAQTCWWLNNMALFSCGDPAPIPAPTPELENHSLP